MSAATSIIYEKFHLKKEMYLENKNKKKSISSKSSDNLQLILDEGTEIYVYAIDDISCNIFRKKQVSCSIDSPVKIENVDCSRLFTRGLKPKPEFLKNC